MVAVSPEKTVFGQMVSKMHNLGRESLLLAHRIWKVKFVGKFRHSRNRHSRNHSV